MGLIFYRFLSRLPLFILFLFFFFLPFTKAEASVDFFLHGSGSNNNPPILFLDNISPSVPSTKFKDSASLNFNLGNPWNEVGTWETSPGLTNGNLSLLSDLYIWLGLKNNDDQGANFDILAEVQKNGITVASGLTRCVTGVTRNPNEAKEVTASFDPISVINFDGSTDVFSLRISTRIGTNPDNSKCGEQNNATGLRLYFDSVNRASRFDATFVTPMQEQFAYVANANYDMVEVVNLTTNIHIASIPVGDQPIGIVQNPFLNRVYVSNSQAGTMSVIDTTTNSVITTISLPGYFLDLAISPDGSRVYAGGWGNGRPVAVIDTATNTVIQTLTGFLSPQHVAVSPDGTKLYVVNANCCPGGPGSLSVLDITNNYALITDIPLRQEPTWVVVTPDGSKIYVSENGGASQGHTMAVIDGYTNTLLTRIEVGINPYGAVVNSTGTQVYVTNTFYWAGAPNGTVSVIDISTDTVITTINVGKVPNNLAIIPDDSKVYVANAEDGTLSVIDATTNTVIDTLTTAGPNPYELVIVQQ